MTEYFEELDDSEFGLRDKHSFEFKFDYNPASLNKGNFYYQEFYLFIPKALQVNRKTYSKESFYSDLTSWIRFKTPLISYEKLLKDDKSSPLYKIEKLFEKEGSREEIIDELKLFGNIFRSQLRNKAKTFILSIRRNRKSYKKIDTEIQEFLVKLEKMVSHFSTFRKSFNKKAKDPLLKEYCGYVDEFISVVIEYNLTGLIREIRSLNTNLFETSDQQMSDIVKVQYNYRQKQGYYSQKAKTDEEKQELFIYRKGLLKKFVMEALLLWTERDTPKATYQHFVSSLAAGVAMLVYLLLFIWQGNVFVMNSTPFVVATVFLYILKDRIKENFKVITSERLFKLFPDFVTKIHTSKREEKVGTLSEWFCFLDAEKLPEEIDTIRNKKFHTEIEMAKRQETVLFYKREICLFPNLLQKGARRCALNNIFRLHITPFLKKASDPLTNYIFLEGVSNELKKIPSPKVYHINMIVKTTFKNKKLKRVEQIQQIRLVVDKEGIKRIEKVSV